MSIIAILGKAAVVAFVALMVITFLCSLGPLADPAEWRSMAREEHWTFTAIMVFSFLLAIVLLISAVVGTVALAFDLEVLR